MLINNLLSVRSRHRSAMSLAEVLVSMGIMTIGLLGVAALFPVGGRHMQSGDIADNANAIAQAALDDAIIRGHLDPENWIILDIDTVKPTNGTVSPISIGEALRGGLAYQQQPAAAGVTNFLKSRYMNGHYGAAYIIDPIGMASALDLEKGNLEHYQDRNRSEDVRRFPATTDIVFNNNGDHPGSWYPWDLSTADPNFQSWPIRRATLLSDIDSDWSNVGYRIMDSQSRMLFQANDDLTQFLPTNGDNPARQRLETYFDNNNNAVAAKRQSNGNYSWIISVSPGSSEARDALATHPDAYQYDVSVVVFHKRVFQANDESNGNNPIKGVLEAERLVNAKVVTTGISGGELLLEKRSTEIGEPYDSFESPFENLRAGEYIMLTGPHPLSTNNRPMLFMQWYKVQTIEDSGVHNINGTNVTLSRSDDPDPDDDDVNETVLVSLRGPDWPWKPGTNLANDLRVGIIPGAVAVHTKTMRLESGSDWGL